MGIKKMYPKNANIVSMYTYVIPTYKLMINYLIKNPLILH